jgi:predicted DNA-binding transcriptional regulator YafY
MKMGPTNERHEDVVLDYTNHRGERSKRLVRPWKMDFTSTEWHPEPQWILFAWDYGKNEDRGFAMKDIHEWAPVPV